MKKLLALFAVLAISACAQDTLKEYVVYKQTSLSSAVETITIQQPSSPVATIIGERAEVYCSAACNITLSQLGTAATATAATVVALNGGSTATALAFSGSDVGAGTTISVINLAAGTSRIIDLSQLYISRKAGLNFSLGTDSISATVRFTIYFQEKP